MYIYIYIYIYHLQHAVAARLSARQILCIYIYLHVYLCMVDLMTIPAACGSRAYIYIYMYIHIYIYIYIYIPHLQHSVAARLSSRRVSLGHVDRNVRDLDGPHRGLGHLLAVERLVDTHKGRGEVCWGRGGEHNEKGVVA